MAWCPMTTSVTFNTSNAGGLPPPKVRVYRALSGGQTPVALLVPNRSAGLALDNVFCLGRVDVIPHGIPAQFFEPSYGLQLELLRYVGKRNGNMTNRTGGLAYVHPSNQVGAASGDGTNTHGGAHVNSQDVRNLRQTEWPVTQQPTVISVTQGMMAFMELALLRYRGVDGAGVEQQRFQEVLCPAGTVAQRQNYGFRYAYPAAFYPGYFQFRYSVRDLQDDRQRRVFGPSSEVVSLSNAVFPFSSDPAASVAIQRSVAEIPPGFNPKYADVWVGRVSRLPNSPDTIPPPEQPT